MREMKRTYIVTMISSLAVILFCAVLYQTIRKDQDSARVIKVGFVYVGDESTPYTNNFILAQQDIQEEMGDRIEVIVRSNVAEGTEEEALRELVKEGAELIFTTSYGYGETTKRFAGEYPQIQFCQATCANANEEPIYSNYHTFMGEIYQGRYLSGIVAGMKLQELISDNKIKEQEAKIGYVAAYPYAEVISGYTAFLLGVRSVVPDAVMTVKYVNTWSSYTLEKRCAQELIEEGCHIISQHSDTAGPAVACEETKENSLVYHVGYNQSMMDVAPTTSLVSCRINWKPYMMAAVEAVLNKKQIEKYVKANVNGNDCGAGFEEDWVQMMELNTLIAADGTQEEIDKKTEAFRKGKCQVFQGNYIGVSPDDPEDVCDLRKGYQENAVSSAPMFHYVLNDVITIE